MAKRSKVGKFFTPKTVISGIVILIAIAAAIGANVIVPYDPNEVDPRSCFLPAFSKGHILGTDKLGRDLLSRLIMGAKSSMLNAFLIVHRRTYRSYMRILRRKDRRSYNENLGCCLFNPVFASFIHTYRNFRQRKFHRRYVHWYRIYTADSKNGAFAYHNGKESGLC